MVWCRTNYEWFLAVVHWAVAECMVNIRIQPTEGFGVDLNAPKMQPFLEPSKDGLGETCHLLKLTLELFSKLLCVCQHILD